MTNYIIKLNHLVTLNEDRIKVLLSCFGKQKLQKIFCAWNEDRGARFEVIRDYSENVDNPVISEHRREIIEYTIGRQTICREKISPVWFKKSLLAKCAFRLAATVAFDAAVAAPVTAPQSKFELCFVAERGGQFAEFCDQLKKFREMYFQKSFATLEDIPQGILLQFKFDFYARSQTEPTPELLEEVSAAAIKCLGGISGGDEGTAEIAPFIDKLQQLTSRFFKSVKLFGAAAIAPSKTQYFSDIYPPTGYFIAEKTDGIRALCITLNGIAAIICDNRPPQFFKIKSGLTASSVPQMMPASTLVLDCEYLSVKNVPYIVAFDIIADSNLHSLVDADNNSNSNANNNLHSSNIATRIYEKPFEARREYLGKIKLELEGAIFICKKFDMLGENIEPQIRAVFDAKYPWEIDGIILVAPGADYFRTKNYKWKPYDQNTIDFLLRKCPESALGRSPFIVKPNHTLYILFVGIAEHLRINFGISYLPFHQKLFPKDAQKLAAYGPIHFTSAFDTCTYLFYSSNAALDGKIVEMRFNDTVVEPGRIIPGEWTMVRIREDRMGLENYYGNDYKIADTIFANIVDKFSIEDLWTPSGYFQKTRSDIYAAPNKIKRNIIMKMFGKYLQNAAYVVDIAAGRGADLSRYASASVQSLLALDIDKSALTELVRRRSVLNSSLRLSVAAANFNDSNEFASILRKFAPEKSISVFVCNFAFHYACFEKLNVKSLLRNIHTFLIPSGVFIFCTLSGERVHEMFIKNKIGANQTLPFTQDSITKYAFTRKYESDKLSDFNQTISVLLPFDPIEKDEPLCNISAVIAVAESAGFALVERFPFAKYIEFLYGDRKAQLTADDIACIELHEFIILRAVDGSSKNALDSSGKPHSSVEANTRIANETQLHSMNATNSRAIKAAKNK